MSTHPAQHTPDIARHRQGWPIIAVAVLHLALFWGATRPLQHSVQHDSRIWLQLMAPLPTPHGVRPPVATAPLPAWVPAWVPAPPPLPAIPPAPATAATPNTTPTPTPAPVPVPPAPAEAVGAAPAKQAMASQAMPQLPAGVLQQALKAVGAIDRQLRAEHPQEFTRPPDTPHTRLAKGYAEAHAAVKPKWFEAARIELFSAPNDPKRIYRVITATGEYCLYLPDKGSMSLNLSARSGYAGFGEASAASCPIRF